MLLEPTAVYTRFPGISTLSIVPGAKEKRESIRRAYDRVDSRFEEEENEGYFF